MGWGREAKGRGECSLPTSDHICFAYARVLIPGASVYSTIFRFFLLSIFLSLSPSLYLRMKRSIRKNDAACTNLAYIFYTCDDGGFWNRFWINSGSGLFIRNIYRHIQTSCYPRCSCQQFRSSSIKYLWKNQKIKGWKQSSNDDVLTRRLYIRELYANVWILNILYRERIKNAGSRIARDRCILRKPYLHAFG